MRTLLALALLSLTSACATVGGGPGIVTGSAADATFANRTAVPAPDALFNVAARSADVSGVSGGTGAPRGERICPRPDQLVDMAPLAAASLAALRDGASSPAPKAFTGALNTSAYRLLMDHDLGRATRDIALIRTHAEANAWVQSGKVRNAGNGSAIDAMTLLLPAWHILRQTSVATDADRATINAWLVRLAAQADLHTGANATASARGANDMMLGLMVGDGARYRKGYSAGYLAQMRAMRPDGSFPAETERGASALARSARNIGLLVYAAEIGLSQGIDLYATPVDGKTIEDAVDFLIRASDDNRLVDGYAAANVGAAEDFLPGVQKDAIANARGWGYLYAKRFPDSESARILAERLTLSGRISNPQVGGAVSCYAGALQVGLVKRRGSPPANQAAAATSPR